jgi:hypothetical protein
MSRPADDPETVEANHLDDVDDWCGCTEIWEHLSEERADGDE